MKATTKNLVESSLVSTIGDIVPHCEIINAMQEMDKVNFEKSSGYDKDKVNQAIDNAYKHLDGLSVESKYLTQAIYRNRLLIATQQLKTALV